MNKFSEKYPLITLLVGIILVVLLYTLWPQDKAKKSPLEEIGEMPRYKIGEVFEGYSAQYRVTGLEFTERSQSPFSDKLPEGSRYFVLTVEVKNNGTEPMEIRCGKLEAIYEGKLLEYECDRAASARSGVFSKLNPQVRKTVQIYYVMPDNVFGSLVWTPNSVRKAKFSVLDIRGASWSIKDGKEVDLSKAQDKDLLQKIKKFFREKDGVGDDSMGATVYTYALLDIDGDGINEILVLRRGPYYCGSGGCALDVLRDDNGELKATAVSGLLIHGDKL